MHGYNRKALLSEKRVKELYWHSFGVNLSLLGSRNCLTVCCLCARLRAEPFLREAFSVCPPVGGVKGSWMLKGFRQPAPECAILAGGLFPAEDDQAQQTQEEPFIFPLTAPKNLDRGACYQRKLISKRFTCVHGKQSLFTAHSLSHLPVNHLPALWSPRPGPFSWARRADTPP